MRGPIRRMVRDGRLRLDRTVEVSVTNMREKQRLIRLLNPNLRTLQALVERNRTDFFLAVNKRHASCERRAAWPTGGSRPFG